MLNKLISRLFPLFLLLIVPDATLWAQPSNSPSEQNHQNLKTITLKDGTKIKGKLVGVQDNVYSIETNSLGRINVKDSDVESISNSEASAPVSSSAQTMKGQVEAMQGQVMADPEFMESLQELSQYPQFIEILQDPEFVNAIMSYDPEKIKNNPKAQMLFQDPKMQKLMQRMSEKHLQHP